MFICIKQRSTSLFLFIIQQLCYSRQNKILSIKHFSCFLSIYYLYYWILTSRFSTPFNYIVNDGIVLTLLRFDPMSAARKARTLEPPRPNEYHIHNRYMIITPLSRIWKRLFNLIIHLSHTHLADCFSFWAALPYT